MVCYQKIKLLWPCLFLQLVQKSPSNPLHICLSESFGHQPSLVPFNGLISLVFYYIYSLAPNGQVVRVTSFQVLFCSNTSISKFMACFHFLSINASDTEEGIVLVFRGLWERFYVYTRNFQRIDSLLRGKRV